MKNLIAQYLKNSGFDVTVKINGVVVALNRKLYTSEVLMALDNEFEGIEFDIRQVGNSVLVVL